MVLQLKRRLKSLAASSQKDNPLRLITAVACRFPLDALLICFFFKSTIFFNS
jgi:hypothetical protein